jgi:hypothetical protein
MDIMSNLIFSFDDLSSKDKAAKQLTRLFKQAGTEVAEVEVDQKIKRSSGVSYRSLSLLFKDSQSVTLNIKQTGDIFQVLINKKLVAIANQDDQKQAVAEIAKMLDAGRARFQKALAKAKVATPPGLKTAAPKLEQVLTEKRDSLKEAISGVREEAARIRHEAGIA